MRSIRRTLTGYLLLLLAVTLAAVWAVIDQVNSRSLAARASASADLIHARYGERCREELDRTDKALLDQAKELGSVLQTYYYTQYETEAAKASAAILAVQYAHLPTPFSAGLLHQAAWTPAGNTWWSGFGRPNPNPWALFRMYFANPPLPDETIRHVLEDKDKDGTPRVTDYLQINTLSGREWRSASLGASALPFNPHSLEGRSEPRGDDPPRLIDWSVDTVTTRDGGETVRRAIWIIPHFGRILPGGPRPRGGGQPRDGRPGAANPYMPGPPGGSPPGPGGSAGGAPGRSLLGTWVAWAQAGYPGPTPPGLPPQTTPTPPPPPGSDVPRLFIQCARPQRSIDAVLQQFAAERDEELARLASEIRRARTRLRLEIAAVGLVAFLAVATGGPLLVGRGLRPVGQLSEAVSRVSEKDFRLPYDGTDLAVELVPIHARLTQTLDLLRRAFAREKQAVADISHELRTPVAALLATLDVTLRKPRSTEQYRATLEECRVICRQLSQLVERIMTLAALDAGNDRTLISRVDAAELAAGCAAVIRPLAAANGITVTTHVEEPLELDTDAGKLREILMNLLHNAVEYNKPQGTIGLTARRDGPWVVFEVRDTGIGMTPEVKERIFERFFRADPSRHATGVHAGLGLAIVREYVDRLGGRVEVESEPDVGSTFRVSLPATPPGARPAAVPPVVARPEPASV